MKWAESLNKLDEGQGAYRKQRSTSDNIFNLYAMAQKYLCKERGRFYCAFIDFAQAFDTIPHTRLWQRLITEGIHGKILCVLRSMYSKLKSCVKTDSGITELFECHIGTRQGCMISPLLFILYINQLVYICQRSGNPGLYLNEDFSSVHVLMYADDLAMVNDTVGRLQAELNSLSQFCQKYGLRVNKLKTKIMVFRNGGKLRNNERWLYDGSTIETVSYYKYLGITFSSRLNWSYALKIIASQSQRALLKINAIFGKCGDMPVSLGLELFDKLVVPILLYGSEVWGYEYRDSIEKVQRKYCKLLLGIASSTPNDVVLGELGRLPLYTQYMPRCIKFWLKVIRSRNRYTKSCYDIIKRLDDIGKITWASHVKIILFSNGFGHVWLAQEVANEDIFLSMLSTRIRDAAKQNWYSNIPNTYCTYKFNFGAELYLGIVEWRRHRVALARLRTGSNQLTINRLKGSIPRTERYCKYCLNHNVQQVEDEYNFFYDNIYKHVHIHENNVKYARITCKTIIVVHFSCI